MPKEKEKCDVCQKEWEMNDPNDWYLGKHYHGQKDGKLIWVCLDCYSTKKQEYLQNYQVFYRNYFDKDGLVNYEIIKGNVENCYAGKKDEGGRILQQQNCPHCQPWKFPNKCSDCQQEKDNLLDYQYRNKTVKICSECKQKRDNVCANCDKKIEQRETKYFGNDGKILCSKECVNIHNENIRKPAKNCSECGKTIDKNQEEWIYTNHEGEKKIFCSSECFVKSKEQQKPQQNDPPKSPNNNPNDKGMSTGLKVFFWIAGTALMIGSIGIMLHKISKKKKKKKS